MNDIEISNLPESVCKIVLDKLAERAYGAGSCLTINHNSPMLHICNCNDDYYLLAYNDNDHDLYGSLNFYKPFTWNDVLAGIVNVASKNTYVSYLSDVDSVSPHNHLFDSTMSIEEILINLALKDYS